MHSVRAHIFLSAVAAVATGCGLARAGEEVMPMVASPYAYVTEEPVAGRQLHKTVVKLTIPSAAGRAALAEELAEFASGPSLGMERPRPELMRAPHGLADAVIPGLIDPEALTSLPRREFGEDLADLVSFADFEETPAYQRFDSAAYTTPISTATFVAPAPEELVMVDPAPVASASLPRPGDLSLPEPIVETTMPPLPYLDPVANSRRTLDHFDSKSQALLPVSPLGTAVQTSMPEEPEYGGAGPLTLLPAPTGDAARIASVDAYASRPVPEAPKGTLNLAGPLLSIRDDEVSASSSTSAAARLPKVAEPAKARKAEPVWYEEPERIGGVPALSAREFQGKARVTAEPVRESSRREESRKAERGFDPLRSFKSIFARKPE